MIIYPEQWTDQGINYALQWSGDLPPDPPPDSEPIVLTGRVVITIAPDRKSMTVEIDKLPPHWAN